MKKNQKTSQSLTAVLSLNPQVTGQQLGRSLDLTDLALALRALAFDKARRFSFSSASSRESQLLFQAIQLSSQVSPSLSFVSLFLPEQPFSSLKFRLPSFLPWNHLGTAHT